MPFRATQQAFQFKKGCFPRWPAFGRYATLLLFVTLPAARYNRKWHDANLKKYGTKTRTAPLLIAEHIEKIPCCMDPATMHKKLLYEHEVLWARYEIRDHHLKKIGEKIYDDVGQVLSLVRIQLCQLDGYSDLLNEDTYEPGELVSKAIRGLRAMHKSFHPETELLAKEGLVKTLEYELELLNGIKKADPIRINGQPQDLVNGTQLIVFRMLQEMLLPIIEQQSGPVAVTVRYEETAVRFVIEYAGNMLHWDAEPGKKQAGVSRLQLPMRAALLGGSLQATAMGDDRICITLTVPFKTDVYEQ